MSDQREKELLEEYHLHAVEKSELKKTIKAIDKRMDEIKKELRKL